VVRGFVPRVGLAAVTISAVVAGGAAAYAFGPSGNKQVDRDPPAVVAADTSGASATPSAGPTTPPAPDPTTPSPTTSPTPAPSPTKASPSRTASKAPAGCQQGAKQQETEAFLAQIGTYGTVTVDGVQSEADCAAIKKFQTRFGLSPVDGKAGPATLDVARRIATSLTPAEQAKCGAGGGTVACIDLTLQTTWVVRDGQLVLGPTVVRTGMKGHATPAGTYKINARNIKEWSRPYEVWLPYWQHFTGGMGFHETTTYIHNSSIGSHGCVNLLRADAKAMWETIGYNTVVKTFGRRAGT
jgi:hypothetical protein